MCYTLAFICLLWATHILASAYSQRVRFWDGPGDRFGDGGKFSYSGSAAISSSRTDQSGGGPSGPQPIPKPVVKSTEPPAPAQPPAPPPAPPSPGWRRTADENDVIFRTEGKHFGYMTSMMESQQSEDNAASAEQTANTMRQSKVQTFESKLSQQNNNILSQLFSGSKLLKILISQEDKSATSPGNGDRGSTTSDQHHQHVDLMQNQINQLSTIIQNIHGETNT